MSQHPESTTRIKVRVQPKASRNQVVGLVNETLRVRVTAPPEDGKANQAVIALLADRLGIAKSRVRITRGQTSRDKLVEIDSLSQDEVLRRLEVFSA